MLASRYYGTLALSDPHREKGDGTLRKRSKTGFSQEGLRFMIIVRISQNDLHFSVFFIVKQTQENGDEIWA